MEKNLQITKKFLNSRLKIFTLSEKRMLCYDGIIAVFFEVIVYLFEL